MKNSKNLMEERGALVEELETLLDGVASEERDFSEEENTRQDSIHKGVADLDTKIKRAKSNEAVFTAVATDSVSKSETQEKSQMRGKFSMTKAISDIVNKGGLEGLEAEMAQEGRREMNESGASARGNITIPSFLMGEARANETYSVDDTNGQNQGNKVRGVDHAPMVEGLRPVSVMERMGATVIQATGNLVLPSLPNGAGSQVAEAASVSNLDGDFGSVTLDPKRFSMRMDLTRQMMNQSDPALDAVIARDMSVALANELDKYAINTNLFASSNITNHSVVSGTSYAATDFQDLTAHEGAFLSNDPAGQNLALLMDPTMAAYLKGVSQSAGGAILNTGNNILGYEVFSSTNVSAKTVVADAYASGITDTDDTISVRPIYFVDPSDLFIAKFGGLDVTIDPLTLAHQGTIRLIANMYANANVRRSGSVQVLGGLIAATTPTTV
jgi:HK97 family phage major capsid protein|tara:strand:- start:516 stop:1844 length:1329 start_codon:yes stop_codon:yes gene_type:complete